MAGINGAEERVDDSLMNLDFNRICRLCLNFCRDYVDLRPSNGTQNGPRHIIDQIKYCYSIKIDLTEPLPSKICLQCIQILTLLGATKRNIKYSEMMLKNILSIRNAHRMINAQNRQGLAVLQRFSSDSCQRGQEPLVAQDKTTQVNISHTQDSSPIQNLRISPIQITTMQEIYRMQDQAKRDKNNQNSLIDPSLNQSTEKHIEKRNIENPRKRTNNDKVVENKSIEIKSNILRSVEIKQNVSSDTNSNSVKCSSSGPSCKTSIDSTLADKNVCKTTKTIEEEKIKNTIKKPNPINNIKIPFEIDRKRELKVKLEVLDLKNTKLFCSSSISGPSGSTEGGGTSGEPRTGKMVKEIGTVIDESNILSPKIKRMRKSIPKG